MNDAIKTQISAFVDGELPKSEEELLLRRMSQDRALRQVAGEYLAIRRVMRGERTIPGMRQLRGRVAAAIDDPELEPDSLPGAPHGARWLRPLGGVAIAATVALAAIVGLQKMAGTADDGATVEAVAEAVDSAYTVPAGDVDQLRDYYQSHHASASYIGADRFNARLVTLELRDGVLVEIEQPEDDEQRDEAATP